MTSNEFDRLLRSRLEGAVEPAPDVWEGIEAGLTRRRHAVIFRRFSVAAAAVAAGLALALLVLPDQEAGRQTRVPATVHAQAEAPAIEASVKSPEAVSDVAPIARQIASFTKNQVTAQAVPPKQAQAAPSAAAIQEIPEAQEAEEAQQAPEIQEALHIPEAEDGLLSESEIPAGYWEALEDEDSRASRKRHTSQISILSNITAVSSEGNLVNKVFPQYAPSQTGGKATSQVEPVSESPKFYSPVSFGVQVKIPIVSRLSVSTGLSYSYLVSQYDMLVDKVRYDGAFNQLHYLGVPLYLSWDFIQTRHLAFYASAGGQVEKCISQRYVYGSNEPLHEKVGGVQWSTNVGLGIEYWFVPRAGIYFDPSLVYFFDNAQPLSIRTQQPLQARFEVGFRFKI